MIEAQGVQPSDFDVSYKSELELRAIAAANKDIEVELPKCIYVAGDATFISKIEEGIDHLKQLSSN